MYTISQIDSHLIGMGHGGTLNKVINKYQMYERSASKFLLKNKPITSMRTKVLTDAVHDDLNDYDLPDDFLSLIDLIPQDNRESWDNAYRTYSGVFDIQKAIKNRTVSIEGSEGTKIIRINWKSKQPKVLHTMDSLTSNGTWAVVGTASGLVIDEITKRKGNASVRFDVATTGDGIQNSTMTAVDMTDEDEVADVLFDVYIKNSTELAKLTSIIGIWGNNLTTALWTGTAQTTQADGSAFKVGWNNIKIPWSTATETGTVIPSTINSLKFTVACTAAISDLRIDNVRFSIGRNFDIKYYSKFLFKNSSNTWISIPTTDDDIVVIDNDGLPILLFELLKDMAHQMEGSDAAFDINYAQGELKELFPNFRSENPNQTKLASTSYGGLPRFRR